MCHSLTLDLYTTKEEFIEEASVGANNQRIFRIRSFNFNQEGQLLYKKEKIQRGNSNFNW